MRGEEAVRQRTQFEAFLNRSPIGVYLVDADFRIRQVNPVALPVFGDIPDLIGRDFDEIIHILWPPEYADEIVRIFRNTLETGEPYIVPERIEERRTLASMSDEVVRSVTDKSLHIIFAEGAFAIFPDRVRRLGPGRD